MCTLKTPLKSYTKRPHMHLYWEACSCEIVGPVLIVSICCETQFGNSGYIESLRAILFQRGRHQWYQTCLFCHCWSTSPNDGMLCYPWSFLPVMAPWFKSIIKHLHRHPKTATSLLLADSPGAEQTKRSRKAEPLETDMNYNQRQSYPNLHYIHITSSVKLGWNLAFHIYIKPMPLTLACHSSTGWLMRVPVVDSW